MQPAGRAQTPAPSRTPRHRGSELGYACKRSIGCTTKTAGAPERAVNRGPTRRDAGVAVLREAERNPTLSEPIRGPAIRPKADPTTTHAPARSESAANSWRQRTGCTPSRTPADAPTSLDCHRGIGHRAGVRRLVPPEVAGLVCCIAACRRNGGRALRLSASHVALHGVQRCGSLQPQATRRRAETIPPAFPTVNHATRSSSRQTRAPRPANAP
jgi:hypothetical protein